MQTLRSLDYSIFKLFNGFAGVSGTVDWLIVFLAKYLPYLVVLFLLVVIYRERVTLKEKVKRAFVIYGTAIVAWVTTNIIRLFYHRPRPFLAHTVNKLLSETNYSFPSGHATFFFALSFAAFYYDRKLGWALFVLALAITVGRIAAGIHYPFDILGGMIVGGIVAFVVTRFVKK